MAETFILIPGRSSRQGVTLNEGKHTDGYRDETSTLRMHPDDMQRLGLSEGEEVRMWNDVGAVIVGCTGAGDECPAGLVFICYGDKSSQLMGGETHGSGMPTSKGLDVFIAPVNAPSNDSSQPQSSQSHVEKSPSTPLATATPAATGDHHSAEPSVVAHVDHAVSAVVDASDNGASIVVLIVFVALITSLLVMLR